MKIIESPNLDIIRDRYLQETLEISRNIDKGDALVADLVDVRKKYGMQELSPDMVRKSRKLLMEFDNAGWVKSPDRALEINYKDDFNKNIKHQLNGDGSEVVTRILSLSEDESKDKNSLMLAHGYSPEDFDLVNVKNSFYSVSKETGKFLYSSSITVKPNNNKLKASDIKEHFYALFQNHEISTIEPTQYEYGAECLVPCFYDVHFAKLARNNISGDEYNYELAKQRMVESTKAYISRLHGRKFEEICFVIGHDFFNSEATGNTTAGTPQDNDLDYATMFKKGIETLIECIDLFSQVSKVKVILVQGNHSLHSEYYCACVLEAWYRDNCNVEIDSEPILRKYYRFGKNLIGLTHGKDEKDRIFSLMQIEKPTDWGETHTREWLTGHLHHESVTEKSGVVVRRVPTICGTDAWHHKTGYVGAKKRTVCFVYDKNDGLVETHYINIK